MSRVVWSETEVVAEIGPLTATRLRRLIALDCVRPAAEGFSEADVARVRLLCELEDDLDIGEEALPVVMGLIDQLHGLRRQMRAMLRAVEAQPAEVRERLRRAAADLADEA